ncbi:hypothetical protein LXL04_006399 [Taraxacum kok-saghyz]
MNEKAGVSKELNARHIKILEGLLKLPENTECADCKTKYVLPMGNERSNSYWEANLPPNYDRDGIENFIRAKYEDKRWVAKEGREIPPPAPIVQQQEEKTPVQWQRPAAKISLPMPPKEPFGIFTTTTTSGIEDLFKDSPPVPVATSHQPLPDKDVKNDIMSQFEKSNNTNVTSPYAVHQQQLSMLAQQQYLIMAAAAKSGGLPNLNWNGQNGNLQNNWGNVGYQFPGMGMPQPTPPGKDDLQKYLVKSICNSLHGENKQMGNMGAHNPTSSSSIYTMGFNATTNGMTPLGNTMGAPGGSKPSPSPATTSSASQSAKDYGFSSLTQGMFSKP